MKKTKAGIILLSMLLLTACSNTKSVEDNTQVTENITATPAVVSDSLASKPVIGEGIMHESIGNHPSNIKGGSKYLPLCRDEVNDIFYYIGDDDCIYASKNGTSTCVVGMEATVLYSVNGDLYFVVAEDVSYMGNNIKKGSVCRYSYAANEVELLITDVTDGMLAEKNGIYYRTKKDGIYGLYYYAIEDGTIQNIPGLFNCPLFYKDNYIKYGAKEGRMVDCVLLVTWPDKEEIILAGEWNNDFTVTDGYFYYTTSGSPYRIETLDPEMFYMVNLETYETTSFRHGMNPHLTRSWFVWEKRLYMVCDNSITIFDTNTGEVIGTYEAPYGADTRFVQLWTDGYELYAECVVNISAHLFSDVDETVLRKIEFVEADNIDPNTGKVEYVEKLVRISEIR